MGRPSVTTEASVVAYLVSATDEDYSRIAKWTALLREGFRQHGALEFLGLSIPNGEALKRHRRSLVAEPPEAWDDKRDILGEKARAIAAGKARRPHTKTDADGNSIGVS